LATQQGMPYGRRNSAANFNERIDLRGMLVAFLQFTNHIFP
jgi:hypothetical protein